MKYFLHDSNAFNDEKITKLFMKYGYEGLGLFYTSLEKFAQQEKPINTEVIKNQLKIGKRLQKLWSFMEEIGIICSSNGESFNKELLKFSEKYQIKKEKNAKRVADFRARHENVMHYERISNAPKVKESKVNTYVQEFFDYFNLKNKTKLRINDKREKIIESRLRTHSLIDLKRAVDNFSQDTWADRHKYCDIVYCIGIRNGVDNLERWLNVNQQTNQWVAP